MLQVRTGDGIEPEEGLVQRIQMRDDTKAGHKELLAVDPAKKAGDSPTLGFGYNLTRYYDNIELIGSYDRYERRPCATRDASEWWFFRNGEVACYRELSRFREWEYSGSHLLHAGRSPDRDHLAYLIFMKMLRDW